MDAMIGQFDGDVPFSYTDAQKLDFGLFASNIVNLNSFKLEHEVLCFEASFNYAHIDNDVSFSAQWKDRLTGRVMNTTTFTMTKEEINSYTSSWFIKFWIGKAWWELRGAAEVELHVDITDPSGTYGGVGSFYANVTGDTIQTDCKDSLVSVNVWTTSIDGRTANFNGGCSTSYSVCSIREITWDFGDETGGYTGFFPQTHVYNQDGLYFVTATAADNCCNESSKTISVQIGEPVIPPDIIYSGIDTTLVGGYPKDQVLSIAQEVANTMYLELTSLLPIKIEMGTTGTSYDGVNNIIHMVEQPNNPFVLPHEIAHCLMTHRFMNLNSPLTIEPAYFIPTWINEGIALWASKTTSDYIYIGKWWSQLIQEAVNRTNQNFIGNFLNAWTANLAGRTVASSLKKTWEDMTGMPCGDNGEPLEHPDTWLQWDPEIPWWERDLIEMMTGYSLSDLGFWARLGLPEVDNLFAWLADTFGVPIGPIDPATGEPTKVILLISGSVQWTEAPDVAASTVNALAQAAQKNGVTYFDELARVDPVGTAKYFAKLTIDQKAAVLANMQADDIGRVAANRMYTESLKWAATDAGYAAFFESLTGAPASLKNMLGAGIGILGFGLFAPWTIKEAVEPSGFGVWAILDSPDYVDKWVDAKTANNNYRGFLQGAKTMLNIAWANPITAPIFEAWFASSMNQADIYDNIIDAQLDAGTLIVMCNELGSTVYINGVNKGITPFEQLINSGPYTILVKKFQYTEDTKNVVITKGGTTIFNAVIESTVIPPEPPVPPEPPEPPLTETGTLQLAVNPTDATIFVAGESQITGPGNYELTPGSYTIQVSKEGFYTKTTNAYVNSGQTTAVSITLTEIVEPPTDATLQILSTPTGADVWIDGEFKFTQTPYTIVLPAGSYIIRLELEGFDPIEETIALVEGEERQYMALFEGDIPYYPPEIVTEIEMVPIEYNYNCWKYSFSAKDAVTGETINAKVFIDGVDTDQWTPRYFYLEPETSYVFKFTRYQYNDAELVIQTAALPTPP